MIKKIITFIFVVLIVILFVKVFMIFTDLITKKKEVEEVTEIRGQISEVQIYQFVRAVEDYCSLEMVKGRPVPDRITDPKEVLFKGELPRKMDITLTEDCRAKGTFTYGDKTYNYDYQTGKIKVN